MSKFWVYNFLLCRLNGDYFLVSAEPYYTLPVPCGGCRVFISIGDSHFCVTIPDREFDISLSTLKDLVSAYVVCSPDTTVKK